MITIETKRTSKSEKEQNMRKLASIRRISDVQPIKDADAIEVATVDGWKVVVKKGEYSAGDLAVYIEIDSWIPHELAPFLSKGSEPSEYNGVKGQRLRTVKLRKQISQGLLLDINETINKLSDRAIQYLPGGYIQVDNFEPVRLFEVGTDLTEILNIQKWEAPISPQLAGQVREQFPTHLVPKTDQERIQNCFDDIAARHDATYEVTIKLDGTSCTIFKYDEELRVCTRNLELKINEENANNTLVAMALSLKDRIPNGYALQGELMGPGIQKNREEFKEHQFYVFDIYDITNQRYLSSVERLAMTNYTGILHVPIVAMSRTAPDSVEHGLELAEGESINHKIREGLVWKCNEDPSFSFKTISNQYLLKSES
jgi:RNA ligase (TIGR02306 family)